MNRRLPAPGGNRWLGIALLIGLAVVALLSTDADEGGSSPETGGPGRGPGESVSVQVLRVVDGDTIEVDLDGRTEDVRYIGVDTPETVKPGAPIECYGEDASAYNKQLVTGQRVRLTFDRELRDRYGRLLAYVYLGDTFVNAELVSNGFARTLEIEPNTAKADELGALEVAAGEAGRGLWSAC